MRTLGGADYLDARIGIFNIRNVRHIDWLLALIVLALAIVGLVALYSASNTGYSGLPYYVKQALFFLAGVMVVLAIVCIDHRVLVSLAPAFYTVAIILLVATLIVGSVHKGGQRWLVVGPFRIQPSEQTKLVLIFMLAWYLTTIGKRVRQLPYFALTFVITVVPMLLILKQPNLGTAAVLGPITLAMLYVAGCKRWHLAVIVILGLAAMPIAYKTLEPYQQRRLVAFVNPEADPKGSGWHTIQSKIAVGSGGLSGKGYLNGTQIQLRYLPEHHTDFIFSVVAEEFGFLGAAGVLGLFLALFLRGLNFARNCPELSGVLLVTGVMTLLGFHVFVNVAITLGLMPVTGIPLPFLSYGGSFYLTTMMCIGVLLNTQVRRGMFT